MRIYEFLRKTKETLIYMQLNIDGNSIGNLNIDIGFYKHMLDQFVINSSFDINIISLFDFYIDYHHIMEDCGIIFGILIKNSIKKFKNINRYGFFFTPLDESLSRVIVDFSNRSYLSYDICYSDFYVGNLNIKLFYDFFLAFCENSKVNLHIYNMKGNNMHHKIESIFKAFGRAIKIALSFSNKINSTKGVLY